MADQITDNLAMLMRVVDRLSPLLERLVFLGGRRNPIASHDLEDMIAVIDGRPEIIGDVAAASIDLRAAIAAGLEGLLTLPDAEDVIAAQLLPDATSQERVPLVLDRIRGLIAAAT